MGLSNRNLDNLPRYLIKFRQNDHPAAFEYLIADIISQVLFLPLHSKKTDNPSIRHRVLWGGEFDSKKKIITKSPAGADSVCYAFGFHILVECTLREGANQWRKEFVESLKHYETFVQQKTVKRDMLYLVVVAKRLHADTFVGYRQKATEGYKIVLLEPSNLSKICDYAKIAFTSCQLDFRMLINSLVENFCNSTSLDQYRKDTGKLIVNWGKAILIKEKSVFFGLKSLAAMNKIGKNTVGTSDILRNLRKDRTFELYLKILGNADLANLVKDGLVFEKFANLISTPDEYFFCRVESSDYRGRSNRLVKAVEQTNE